MKIKLFTALLTLGYLANAQPGEGLPDDLNEGQKKNLPRPNFDFGSEPSNDPYQTLLEQNQALFEQIENTRKGIYMELKRPVSRIGSLNIGRQLFPSN